MTLKLVPSPTAAPRADVRADVADLAAAMFELYLALDDREARELRAAHGLQGPRPAGAAERWAVRMATSSAQPERFRPHAVELLAAA